MTRPVMTLAQAMQDKNLLQPWFPGRTYAAHLVIAKAAFGEMLSPGERVLLRELTGLTEAPTTQCSELWLAVGRRASKTILAAAIAVYLATIGNERYGFSKRLKPGEVGVAQIMATDRDTAAKAFGFCVAMFRQPLFAQLVANITGDAIELKNGLAVEVIAASSRRSRGRSTFAIIMDEVAHFLGEGRSVNPDVEILSAVIPGLATMGPGAMVIGISSPLARSGLLFDKYERHYGKPGRVLFVQAPTWRMNPTLAPPDQPGVIADAYAADSIRASAEWGAEFRSELNSLLEYEVIASAVDRGTIERPAQPHLTYHAFADVSGGRNDPSTLGIAHMEGGRAVLDCLRVVPAPHEPAHAIADFATTLAAYGCSHVVGDNYAGNFTEGAFRDHGITYQASKLSRSELYLELLPLMNSRKVVLLDNGALIKELAGLERRAAGRGRDSVDHSKAKGSHDDRANVLAGAVFAAMTNVSVTLPPGDPGFFRFNITPDGFRLAGQRRADRPRSLRY